MRRWLYWPRYVAIIANIGMFALFAIVVSPVIMGPAPAIIMIMLLAAQRRLVSIWIIAVLTALAVISPWLLQLAGLIDPIISVSNNDVILHTMGSMLGLTKVVIGLVFYCVVMTQLAALMARAADDDRRLARRTNHLQTWQLRQLMPRAQTSIPPG